MTSPQSAVLHMVCGKIASGKSTLASELGKAENTIVVSEDRWLAALYPEDMNSLEDFVRNSKRLRSTLEPHLIALLREGLSVVLDFAANTPGQRGWLRSLIEGAGCAHQLHYLEMSDEVCKARLRLRNASGSHEFYVSEEQFEQFTRYFVPPSKNEGFNIVVHASD